MTPRDNSPADLDRHEGDFNVAFSQIFSRACDKSNCQAKSHDALDDYCAAHRILFHLKNAVKPIIDLARLQSAPRTGEAPATDAEASPGHAMIGNTLYIKAARVQEKIEEHVAARLAQAPEPEQSPSPALGFDAYWAKRVEWHHLPVNLRDYARQVWDAAQPPPGAKEGPKPAEGTPKDDSDRGLYQKYQVRRTDGSSGPGGKHEHCDYFILDLVHDRHAFAALLAYAESCTFAFPQLSADLRARAYAMAQAFGIDWPAPSQPQHQEGIVGNPYAGLPFECPVCGQGPWEKCRESSGAFMSDVHRHRAALAAPEPTDPVQGAADENPSIPEAGV